MTERELPADYEPCGECGFDHAYEWSEAYEAHLAMRPTSYSSESCEG